MNDKCTLVSSHDIVRQALVRNKIDYVLVYPAMECKEEFLLRYRKRGSELKFIDLLDRNWENWINECKAQEGCVHIELKPGQYLSDVISYDPQSKEFDIKKAGDDERRPYISGITADMVVGDTVDE